jgi:hypothetical protein
VAAIHQDSDTLNAHTLSFYPKFDNFISSKTYYKIQDDTKIYIDAANYGREWISADGAE